MKNRVEIYELDGSNWLGRGEKSNFGLHLLRKEMEAELRALVPNFSPNRHEQREKAKE